MARKFIKRPMQSDRTRLGMAPVFTKWNAPSVHMPQPTGWTYSSANYGLGHTAYNHVGHTAYNHVGDSTSTIDSSIASSGLWSAAGAAIGAYHGYKRNKSVGWALVWGMFGAISPIITSAVAFAQGIGTPKHKGD